MSVLGRFCFLVAPSMTLAVECCCVYFWIVRMDLGEKVLGYVASTREVEEARFVIPPKGFLQFGACKSICHV